MHEILWKCKCDAMHEQTWSFKQNPTQKFCKNLINFQKPQKPKSKWMKWMIQERKKIIPDEEHKVWAENQVGYVKRLSEKCLGKRKEIFCREKWRENRAKAIYRKHKTRWIESCRALILDNFICRGAIESYQWQRNLDGSNSYRASIEQIESFSMDRESVEKLSRQIQESFDGSRLR